MIKSTLTKTKSSRNTVAFIEGDQSIKVETAAVVAPIGPQGMFSMGTFPSSLIALGWIRRRDFCDALDTRGC